MSEWTPSAKAELETYFQRVRPSLEQSGADAAEVVDDLKRHLDEEIAASKLTVVTEEDVRRLLNRIGDGRVSRSGGQSAKSGSFRARSWASDRAALSYPGLQAS